MNLTTTRIPVRLYIKTAQLTPYSDGDVLALLNSVCKDEGVITTPSRATADRRTQKRPMVDRSSQSIEDSDCPQMTQRRLKNRPATMRSNPPPTPTLLLVPDASIEFANSIGSLVGANNLPMTTFIPEPSLLPLNDIIVEFPLS
ncbi:hypothetical protein J1N35_005498 [Gossypium stocksii]|uniref:Uncharacterized protein n=1 Tax=Gossypium stocksii TaxID=47602 RepID=A0A9D3WEM2_9ROSI|nr:hypothetical protein J1N35_005498 [Gossypium stocksii]